MYLEWIERHSPALDLMRTVGGLLNGTLVSIDGADHG